MKRLLSLDVLRGIAVLLVIVRHTEAAEKTLFEPFRRGGWVGVDLFFVLSGFLVSGLLFHEFERDGQIKPFRFLLRRGWKIYPAFWALLAATIAICYSVSGDWAPQRTLTELTFMQSYFNDRWCAHTWSLAVEEHFYLLLPLMLLPMLATRFAELPRIVGAIMVGLLVAKCINGLAPFTEQTHLFPTHLRLDGLFFGVLLSHWYHTWEGYREFGKRFAIPLVALGSGLLLPAFLFNVETTPALYTFWLTAQILGSGAILTGLVCGGVHENLATRCLGWIGTYSYSTYLWHNLVIVILAPLLGVDQSVVLILLLSVSVGIAMSKLIETPSLWLRARLA